MFHMKNPTQIRKAKATAIIQINRKANVSRETLALIVPQSRFFKTTV